ncbi:MAG: ABC transporter ATP-binding protein [Spirochaetes bacterium]|nr:ABC transporter ATP-binding protein [Spirochaetota bacterium]
MSVEERSAENSPMSEHLKFYFSYFGPYRHRLGWVALYYLLKRLPTMLVPLVVMTLVDNYIPSGEWQKMVLLAAAVVAALFFNIVFHTSYAIYANAEMVKNVSKDIRNHIVQRLQLLSVGFLNRNHSGRLFSKIMVDVDKMEGFANQFLDLMLNAAISLGFACVVLSTVNFKLFLFYIAFIPGYLLLYRFFIKRILRSHHELRLANERLSKSVGSFIQTQTLARLHGEEAYERERFRDSTLNELEKIKRLRLIESFFGSSNSVLSEWTLIGVVCLAAFWVIQGQLTLGSLLLFLQFITVIMDNVRNILNFFPQLTMFAEAVVSVKEVLESPDLEHNEGKPKAGTLRGDVTFQNVTFSHVGQTPLFRDLTVLIKAGKTVALVGESGSGKTTFVNLLLGLYRVQDGTIKIDDTPLGSVDMRTVRRQMGVVTQDAIIFSGSVSDNIAHARQKYTQKDVVQAARDAHADEFIRALPKGYDTLIGEGGVQLSGGQRQRISIARAIFRKPKILILDEATSALDSESEAEVQKALDGLAGRQTTFIIAHRLSTIFRADRILVFREGRIIEEGTHRELVMKRGEYARLLAVQMRMEIDEIEKLVDV